MVKSAWHDVSYRGRRLEQVSKLCMSRLIELQKKGDVDSIELSFSYLDRLLRTEQAIKPYIEEYLGVKRLLKDATTIQR